MFPLCTMLVGYCRYAGGEIWVPYCGAWGMRGCYGGLNGEGLGALPGMTAWTG